MKFVKVGEPVEAVQYDGDTGNLPYEMGVTICRSYAGGSCFLPVDGHIIECRVGDWIVREPLTDLNGHKLYPVAAEEFTKRFHPAPGGQQA